MYRSENTDPVVRYYDETLGISGEGEEDWYLGMVRETGGPILDLGCGTGRLALLFARSGFEVTGIDQSSGMLHLFRQKLNQEDASVRQRVRLINESMIEFNAQRKFAIVVCCDAFFHNLTVEDEIACLSRVREHLKRSGLLVFNLPNPSCDFIAKCKASQGTKFEERGRYKLMDGSGSILIEQAQQCDEFEQRVNTTLRFTKYQPDGSKVTEERSSWASRYIYRYEAIHLLHRMGFSVQSLVGDYKGGEVSKDSQLIFTAEKVYKGEA